MEFSASMDKTAKLATIFIAVLFTVLIVISFTGRDTVAVTIISVMLAAIFVGTFSFSVRRYSLTSDKIIIHRFIGNKILLRNSITSIEITDQKQLGFVWRTLGVGGLFGYFGYFYSRSGGNMMWFVTRQDRLVIFHKKDGDKILISPDDRDVFISEYNKLPS